MNEVLSKTRTESLKYFELHSLQWGRVTFWANKSTPPTQPATSPQLTGWLFCDFLALTLSMSSTNQNHNTTYWEIAACVHLIIQDVGRMVFMKNGHGRALFSSLKQVIHSTSSLPSSKAVSFLSRQVSKACCQVKVKYVTCIRPVGNNSFRRCCNNKIIRTGFNESVQYEFEWLWNIY